MRLVHGVKSPIMAIIFLPNGNSVRFFVIFLEKFATDGSPGLPTSYLLHQAERYGYNEGGYQNQFTYKRVHIV